MPAPVTFEYAIVRVVPDVVREEHINVGAVVFCADADLPLEVGQKQFLCGAIELDERRLLALAPEVDLSLVRAHLAAIPKICAGGPSAGPMGALPPRERFAWLVSPRNGLIQLSPPHAGLCDDADAALERLLVTMVRR